VQGDVIAWLWQVKGHAGAHCTFTSGSVQTAAFGVSVSFLISFERRASLTTGSGLALAGVLQSRSSFGWRHCWMPSHFLPQEPAGIWHSTMPCFAHISATVVGLVTGLFGDVTWLAHGMLTHAQVPEEQVQARQPLTIVSPVG